MNWSIYVSKVADFKNNFIFLPRLKFRPSRICSQHLFSPTWPAGTGMQWYMHAKRRIKSKLFCQYILVVPASWAHDTILLFMCYKVTDLRTNGCVLTSLGMLPDAILFEIKQLRLIWHLHNYTNLWEDATFLMSILV